MRQSIIGRGRIIISLFTLAVAASISNAGAAWVNATGNLAGMSSECGDLQSIWAVPNVNKVVTGVANQGIYNTTNGGTSWAKTSGSVVTFRMTQMVFDPINTATWYACGIYHSPGIAKTTDGGATWQALGNTYHHDGMAVDFSDPQRKTLLAGTHEQQSTLWRSTNGGTSWTNIGCPGGGYSSFPYIVNTQTYLININGSGTYRSDNAGSSWNKVGNATYGPIIKSGSGELYCAGTGFVNKGSADGTTWTYTTMPIANYSNPIELPGDKIASINNNGIYISADKGATFKKCCSPLPTALSSGVGAWGLCYNSVAGAFYAFTWNCGSTVGANEIWRYDTLLGSTDVVNPRHAVRRLVALKSRDGAIFDIAGRSVQYRALINNSALCSEIFLVRTGNGSISRRVSK